MKKQVICFLLFISIIFSSCLGFFDKEKKQEPKPIEFHLQGNSALFNNDYFKFSLDSFNNYLCIKMEGKSALKKFPFPKDGQGNILSATAFDFVLIYNGKPIENANLIWNKKYANSYFGYNRWLSKDISFKSDTIDLASMPAFEFKIPFYTLHKLKSGIQNIEILCTQNIFCSAGAFRTWKLDSITKDTVNKYSRHYKNLSSISFKVAFKIIVPQIFCTTLYGQGIELRNDSVYSPAGMDNTIWNSSYPDIYWTVNYPKNEFYCSSDYQKSTDHYSLKDTFYLFHYTPYDSISIGVWDHDNLSRDDYIAYKNFSLNEFPQNKNIKLSFGNIKCFEIQAVKGFAVNK